MNLCELTIKQAQEGLAKKKFSSLELTQSCLERIRRLDKKIKAFITVCGDKALVQAEKADKKMGDLRDLGDMRELFVRYPLLGIPIALKDLYAASGIKTTAGSKVLENYIGQYDGTVVKRLKEAGAIIIGKTNCDAWAHGSSGENSDFGPTRNPWDLEKTPGGSSSGSAAAVSVGECLASTGTDTGGSIRLPASFCNMVGLKPTYGRVPRYGVVAMASSLDSMGHFTKTVYDSALVLKATAGKDFFDATSSSLPVGDYPKNIDRGVRGIKIGIPKEYFIEGVDTRILKKVKEAIKKLEALGAKTLGISLPHAEYAMAVYYIIQPAEVSSNLGRYDGIRFGNARETFGDEAKRRIMLGTYTLSAGYYEAYYLKAMKVRTLIKKDFEEAFKKVEVIIAPTSPSLAWKLGEKVDDPLKMYLSDIFTVTANLAGIPGLAIPCGFVDSSTSLLPVGMQILGPHFSEGMLFQVGYAYEQATQWYKIKPKL